MKYLCAIGFGESGAGTKEDDPRYVETQPYPNMFYKSPRLAAEIPAFLDLGYGIIFMVRHPRGNLTSKLWSKRKLPVPYDRAQYWCIHNRIYLRYSDEPSVVLVRYEDLVRKPDEQQSRIAERFGLDVETPFTECHRQSRRFKKDGPIVEKECLMREIKPENCRLMPKLDQESVEYFKVVMPIWGEQIKSLMPLFDYDPRSLP